MIEYPNSLDKIFDKLRFYGARPIIIGGYIRDYLLSLDLTYDSSSKDIDIEVYNVESFEKLEDILQEFGSVNNVGKSFGVCKLKVDDLTLDFTLPRIDNKVSIGHKGFDISVKSNLNFITATSRRDFTINAIGYDTTDKLILDPYNGRDDLKNKILRAVNLNTFSEDPLRVLRAVQFCARFDLEVEKKLFTLCKSMIKKNILNQLPKERIFEEIKKLLLKPDKPSIGFKLLKKLGGLNYFNELDTITNDEWNLLLVSVDELAKNKTSNKKTDLVLMLSALCYKMEEANVLSFIQKLTNEKTLLERVPSLTSEKIADSYTDSELFRLATKVSIKEFVILNRAVYKNIDTEIFNRCNKIQKRASELNILNKKITPILKGRDILSYGIKPSKDYSKILSDAYEAQMNLEFASVIDAHSWLKQYLIANNFRL